MYFISCGYMFRSEIAGSYCSFIFNLLRNLQTIFHSSCLSLYSHQCCISVPFSPHPHQHFFSLVLMKIDIFINVRQYFIFPWWLIMLSTFSCIYWSFVYLLWKNALSLLVIFFQLFYYFCVYVFAIELYKFLVYFGY